MTKINFHFEEIDIPNFSSEFFRLWIEKITNLHQKTIGELNYIFCSDTYILNINRQYLNHDYFTDIITFNYNENTKISGDIFISYETIIANAIEYNNGNTKEELDRVVIHGVLHLIGFNDKTDKDQIEMTKQENLALELRKNVSRETL